MSCSDVIQLLSVLCRRDEISRALCLCDPRQEKAQCKAAQRVSEVRRIGEWVVQPISIMSVSRQHHVSVR
ncbi:hypothetical protein E2C01_089705 [Portunus trituberculatus]|uniref:Uncharacterized protein n=1 Tax=Portunus trituberculatus TaxID=210409 RepID=A0A5B7JEA3_PORTR|nr:hypothetical protein [Portunus trituberculatus]